MKFYGIKENPIILGSAILVGVILGGGLYGILRIHFLSSRVNALSAEVDGLNQSLASTTSEFRYAINQAHESIAKAVSTDRQNVGDLKQQLGTFSGTVTTLQKLATIDPELLKKYSKVYFLNDNYIPARLAEIPSAYEYSDAKQLLIFTDVLPHFTAMIDDATSTGIQLYAESAYRSFAEQRALKGQYTVTYGAGTANSFSADQGYSEHQLGTAVDFISSGQGGVLDGFDNTNAYHWMLGNAYKYGFVLSYPKNNSYYVFEPWHWRFVGVQLATELHNDGKNFYDLDQRTIDTYLANIFD